MKNMLLIARLAALPLLLLAHACRLIERVFLEGTAEGAAASLEEAADALDRIHGGEAHAWAAWFAAGVAALGLVVLVGVLR